MSGRFLTKHDIASAKHEEEVYNSLLKRGKIENADKIVSQRHVVCGCGAIGCIFMHFTRDYKDDI